MGSKKNTKLDQQLAYLAEFRKQIRSSTPIDINEKETDKLQRIAKLEHNFEDWKRYYFPKFAKFKSAPFHFAADQRVISNPEYIDVRHWFRGASKSVSTMVEILYLTLVKKNPHLSPELIEKYNINPNDTRKRTVLCISNSHENAERLLNPFKANLESNQRLINDYGEQKNTGLWTSEEFTTKSGVAFRAVGADQSPRGSRNEELRPDVILFDDIDTDADCRNPEIIKKRWEWVQEAVIPTRDIATPLLVIWCGNRIADDCCVIRAGKTADNVDIINVIDENGLSTWPEKNNDEAIQRLKSTMSYASFSKEYMNQPINEGTVFKSINYKTLPDIRDYKMLCCYTDPSYKDTEKNDFKATVLVGAWRDEFHVIKAHVFQGSIAQMVENHYDIARIVGQQACYYLMEEVFMQDLFFSEFLKIGKQKGMQIPISGDTRQKPQKFSRIETLLEPLNRNEKLFFNIDEKDNPGMKALEQQFIAFGPQSRAHDDGPDAVEGAVWTLNNKIALISAGQIEIIARSHNNKTNI